MLDSLFVKVSCKLNSGRLIAQKFGFPNEGHFEQWADTDSKNIGCLLNNRCRKASL